jgi:hypothetical protein
MKSNRTVLLRTLLFLLSAGLFIGLIYFLKIGINVFEVKHILVSGDPVQLEINKTIFVNNILFFPVESVSRQLKLDNPMVKSVEIRKKFPSTLEFIIKKRIPIATVVTDGIQIGIDDECVITEPPSDGQAPVITTSISFIRIGAVVKQPMVVQAVAFITRTKPFIQWSSMQSYETQSIRARSGQIDIFITQTSDLSQIVDTLQTLMEGFRIKGIQPKSIDLRFGKPIVQF